MAERSVHEAAVEAMAGALWGLDSAWTPHEKAEAALAALVASAEVREAAEDAPCLLHPGQAKCGGAVRGANVRFHLPCLLAALASPEAHPTERGSS